MAQRKKKPTTAARAAAQPPVAAAVTAIKTTASTVVATGLTSVGGVGLLALGSSLSIREVGERAAQFKALIAAGSAEVDVGKLESIDTAGLQLLLAAAAAARRHGLTLRLHGAGSLNSGAASALGLADHLAATAEILP